MAELNSGVDSVTPVAPVIEIKPRLFGRTVSVHELLGGGQVADILLWKKKVISASILGAAAVAWILFEWSKYTLITLVANTSLILLVAVFLYSTLAYLLKREPVSVPKLALSEEVVHKIAFALTREVNHALELAHNVALGRNYILTSKVSAGLYLLGYVGSLLNTLSLLFLAILLLFTIPFLYNTYEDLVDEHIERSLVEVNKLKTRGVEVGNELFQRAHHHYTKYTQKDQKKNE